MNERFSGFPKGAVEFYRVLGSNNTREWFEQHRAEFDDMVLNPAKEFVQVMGDKLRALSPRIVSDPRTDRSVFRHYRDVRFSKDKSPYKTNLGIIFWEGSRVKKECPGFYFHFDSEKMMIATGHHNFSKPVLKAYRDSVVHPEHGKELTKVLSKVLKNGAYQLGGKTYKKTPRGFDPNHPNSELLLHAGLYAYEEVELPPDLHTPDIVEFCFKRYKDFYPLHRWILDVSERAGA